MKALDLLKNNKPPKILIYGAGGTGKTALVSQASRGYLMDFDDGMRTAARLEDQWSPLRQEIEFDCYAEENPQRPLAWLKAKAKLISIMNECNKGTWSYDCLVIDSLSGLAEVAQNQIMAACNKPMGKPEIREWGMIVSEVENAIQIIKCIPTLVLITAHELPIVVDGDTRMKILAPGTKLPAKIPTWFDEVWYAKTRRGAGRNPNNYIVSGRKTSSIEARTRSGMDSDVTHNELGLAGVLNEIGFTY